ncbi:hypothetical protein Y032_0118g749 [Ancylostoma ceylanicum]|uniref:Uncharacterized protein n=1 Tax=Ancylostoma ceylanicum TaxID=53326 RepID=A0A016TBP4_9BILA|nr:hypothetical protein Y032_0118g749 [Ancylostoma ceylanicum]
MRRPATPASNADNDKTSSSSSSANEPIYRFLLTWVSANKIFICSHCKNDLKIMSIYCTNVYHRLYKKSICKHQ